MNSSFAEELLFQIRHAPWSSPGIKSLDDFGVSVGGNIGAVRKRNEDRAIVASVGGYSGEQYSVAIVCDGVGGSEMGDEAANLAICTFLECLVRDESAAHMNNFLTSIVRRVDDRVRDVLNGRGTTTLSALIVNSNGQISATNVGDSRIYAWEPGGSLLKQVSTDDSMENELRGLSIKDSSILGVKGLRGRLSQAIGEAQRSSGDLRVVIFDNADFSAKGAVLASDGAWKGSEEGFRAILKFGTNANDTVKRLFAFATWTGGIDNISMVAIEDFKSFAELGAGSKLNDRRNSSISVWMCDTKVVLNAGQNRKQNYLKSSSDATDLGKKLVVKGKKRNLNKASKSLEPIRDIQPSLIEPETEKGKKSKLKVEVTIDEGPMPRRK